MTQDATLSSNIATNSEIAQKIWRRGLIHQAEWQWIFRDLIGTGDHAAIQMQEEPGREPGDTIQLRFSPTDDQGGFGENDTIEGNEADVRFFFDEMKIGYWAFAYKLRNPMAQQRVNIPLKKAILTKLPINWKRYWERAIVHQLSGFVPANSQAGLTAAGLTNSTATDNNMGGMNAITRVDANHIFRAKSLGTNALVAADTDATMSLEWIDELQVRANSAAYLDYPIPATESGYHYLIIHPEQLKQLRQNTSAGDWQDITRARLEGGEGWQRNPIYRGHAGMYNNTIIVVSDYIQKAPHDSEDDQVVDNTRVAVFIGAKAGCCAFGQGYTGGEHLDWVEQIRDYKVFGVVADSVWGFKRTTFPNPSGAIETYGAMNLVTYSAV